MTNGRKGQGRGGGDSGVGKGPARSHGEGETERWRERVRETESQRRRRGDREGKTGSETARRREAGGVGDRTGHQQSARVRTKRA